MRRRCSRANRQLLGAYDPSRRLAQGWSIVTNARGRGRKVARGRRARATTSRYRVSDGTFDATVNGREGARHEYVSDWNEAANELNAIVASFDEGEVSVDELFAKLERATAIIEALEARLALTKAKVDELTPRIARVVDDE